MKRRKLMIGTAVAALVTAVATAAFIANAAEVKLFTVKKGAMQETVELRGKVDLEKKERITSRLSGILHHIGVQAGDTVEVNSELALLEIDDLNLALSKAKAAYEAAKASLEELKKSIRPEQVKQAQLQLEQAGIAMEQAQKDFNYKKDRLEKVIALSKSGAAAEQDVKDARTLADAAEGMLLDARARYESAKANLELMNKGVSKEAIDAASATVEQARLQVEELQKNVGRSSVFSPIKGVVTDKMVEKGEAVQPGTALFEVGDPDTAFIKVNVLSDDAAFIRVGQKAIVHGEVLGDQRIPGEVYYIAPKAQSTVSSLGVEQQRVEMKIRMKAGTMGLKPGYGVDVDIIRSEKEAAIYVPEKAIFEAEGKDSVFIVKGGRLELRQIKTGMENEDFVEVLDGVGEGDQVVKEPDNSLKPGMHVRE